MAVPLWRNLFVSLIILLILLAMYMVALYQDVEVVRTLPEVDKTAGIAEKELKIEKDGHLLERIEQRQTVRQQRLRDYCEKHASSRNRSARYHHPVIVNDEYKVIFCYIPKVACSQWKRVFLALDNRTDVDDVHDDKHYKFLLYDYSDEDIKVRLKSYFKFLFVREPLERLLSAYNNKLVNNKWPWGIIQSYKTKILERYKQDEPSSNSFDQGLTFRKFIYYVSDVGFDANAHWRSYGPICHPCDIKYDFIGHFEDMPEEAPYILRQTGMDRAVTFPPFLTHNTTSQLLKSYAPIPKEKIAQLGKAFEEDFEMFNYDFPGPLSDLMHD
ncbi:unnamed protein product [Porites lobata]|uniref:Carbohydrate sulfotransferase n=1 Tax=Porites lobata TaxID=104759 RepID=A0ABN8N5E2_9CNID|nr:unnamed protein product [Porites lobata]